MRAEGRMGAGGVVLALVALLYFTASCTSSAVTRPCYVALATATIKNPESADGGFFRIAGMRAGAEELYVLEAGANRLVAFDMQGRERWQGGRQGAGPAEFENPASLTISSDHLLVWDYGNNRISIWSVRGSHVGVVAIDEFGVPGSAGWIGGVDTTSVLAVTMSPFRLMSGGARPSLEGQVVVARRHAHQDTLLRFTFPATQAVNTRSGTVHLSPPYAARATFSVLSDGLVAVSSQLSYEVEVFDLRGVLRARVATDEERPSVSDEHRADYRRTLENSLVAEHVSFPDRLPAVAQVYGASDGALLIETYWRSHGLTRWDRWRMDGTFEYSLMLPTGIAYLSEARGLLFGRIVDSVGLERIQAFRHEQGGRCPGPGAQADRD